jgi:YgiT-type zinc finger domain-containing protein
MKGYADCSFCGGEVTEKKIDYDYRRQSHLLVISNVPAGVCGQCGEKYFKPEILKKMDDTYHNIFDRNQKPQRTLTVPTVSL